MITSPTLTKRGVAAELSSQLANLQLKIEEEAQELADLAAVNVKKQSDIEVPHIKLYDMILNRQNTVGCIFTRTSLLSYDYVRFGLSSLEKSK